MLRKAQFAAVGLTGVAVSFGSLFFFINVLHWNHSIAYGVQTVLAIEVNFLLNDAITWRDRRGNASFLHRAARFHATRIGLMIPINQVMFGILQPKVGTAEANLICIAVTTIANWFLNDRLVFRAAPAPVKDLPTAALMIPSQRIGDIDLSVIVPVRNSHATIRACVDSLLDQTMTDLEVIVVGDEEDTTWDALADIRDSRLRRLALNIDRDGARRDSNLKRSFGMRIARGSVLALTDSDMTLPPDWAERGLEVLDQGYDVAGGGMISETTGFMGRYVDTNALAAKTPRSSGDYILTKSSYGRKGFKPPITATLFLNRRVYETVGGPDPNFTRSFEDYEWARRIIDARFPIMMTSYLDGLHRHHTHPRTLFKDYARAGAGCADYIRKHSHCRFARNRRYQASSFAIVAIALAAVGLLFPLTFAVICMTVVTLVCYASYRITRTTESLLYPFVTLILGAGYWYGLVRAFAPGGSARARPTVLRHQLHEAMAEVVA